VAHDFNNLLTLILGYGNLLLQPLTGQPELRRQLELILQAGNSAAALTRQLLAFSRRQVLVPAVLDLSALVGHLEHMLRRVIGEDVELVTDLAPDLGHVLADPGQLEQVIMNLAVNSRDAMPDGGRLTIATRNCAAGERPAALAAAGPAPAGPAPAADPAGAAGQQVAALAEPAAAGGPMSHVALSISDTGAGISAAVMEHLFEPFFTTKEEGKGTGLGLATVYGIVHQSGGRIEVESQPGAGATFVIYLPRTEQAAPGAPRGGGEAQRGSETILVVEDQAEIRSLARIILEELGYEVLVAAGAEEALRIARQRGRKIHLLLTDVIMPQVSGVTLAAQLSARQPGIRVLFMSGYTDRAVKPEEMPPGAAFLQKPFDPAALARLVREALGPRPA
jgi:CheY-like chemotaxis protein